MKGDKQLLLDEVNEKVEQSQGMIVMQYQGLTANAANDFRNQIAQSGAEFEVVKKRLLLLAAKKKGYALEKSHLVGHIGVVVTSNDLLEATKAVYQFKKENKDLVNVILGFFDGQVYAAAEVEKLSTLPNLEEMRAQLLGLLESPMSQLLQVMNALSSSIVYCLDGRIGQQEGQ